MPRANRTRSRISHRTYRRATYTIIGNIQNIGSDSYQQHQALHYTQHEPEPEPHPARPFIPQVTVNTTTALPGLVLDNWATLLRRLYPSYLLPFLETGEFNAYAPIRLIHNLPIALDGEQAALAWGYQQQLAREG